MIRGNQDNRLYHTFRRKAFCGLYLELPGGDSLMWRMDEIQHWYNFGKYASVSREPKYGTDILNGMHQTIVRGVDRRRRPLHFWMRRNVWPIVDRILG